MAGSHADDIAFAREVDRHTIAWWSPAWPRINELSRAGLLRVRAVNRYMAEVEATDQVSPETSSDAMGAARLDRTYPQTAEASRGSWGMCPTLGTKTPCNI